MPNRAVRRHPVGTKSAKGRPAAPRSVLGPTSTRPAAKREGRPGLTSWRPRFLMDIITELRKVVWPSRQDTIHLTIVVVIVAVLMGALLGSIDVGFGWIIDRALLR